MKNNTIQGSEAKGSTETFSDSNWLTENNFLCGSESNRMNNTKGLSGTEKQKSDKKIEKDFLSFFVDHHQKLEAAIKKMILTRYT
jgi:hypothetical protein